MEYDSLPAILVINKIQELKQKGFLKHNAEDFATLIFLPKEANLTEVEKNRLVEYKRILAEYEQNHKLNN